MSSPQEKFLALAKSGSVSKSLQEALEKVFQFTKLSSNDKIVALEAADAIGQKVPEIVWKSMYEVAEVLPSDKRKEFLLKALGDIRGNIVTNHFKLFYKAKGGNASSEDLETLVNALPTGFTLPMGQIIKASFSNGSVGVQDDADVVPADTTEPNPENPSGAPGGLSGSAGADGVQDDFD